ncbi:MAG: hypothetical protein JNL44_15530 [Gemmatimonadetes bacterium]|nr:hypothetical protein [Gemmatimonadota bacterium]
MAIDWSVVVDVAVPVGTLFLGVLVQRWFESRPSLISYFGHVSAFKFTNNAGEKSYVYTHSVVLRNAGRKTATNVRLQHGVLPEFEIYPPVDYHVHDLPSGSKEIVIPVLVPHEQITINYLYFPPLTYANVNQGIKSDEGFAREIPVLLQRQYSGLFNFAVAVLLLVGLVTLAYLSVLGARWLLS